MERTFIYTTPFRRSWDAMGLDDNDLLELEQILRQNPTIGDMIPGLHGARKMRIQLEGRGKRGGGRVIYLDLIGDRHTYMLFAYPKNVQENITPSQQKALEALVLSILADHKEAYEV